MLRIHALGGLHLTSDGQPLASTGNQPKRLALLAVLAVAGDRGVTADTLLSYLWPDLDEERGREALTQAQYALRRDLGSDEGLLGMQDLRLNPDMVTSDVAGFRDSASTDNLDRAAELWCGPFLEGFHLPGSETFERWVEDQRAGLQYEYTAVLDQLAGRALERGDARTAAGWLRKLAATDPLNAQVTARLMQALKQYGDGAGALQQARLYEALVRREQALPPDHEVVTLLEQLQRREASALLVPGAALPVASPATQSGSAPPQPPGASGGPRGSLGVTIGTPSPAASTPPRASPAGPRWVVRVVGVVVGAIILFSGYRIGRALLSVGSAPARSRVIAVGRVTHHGITGTGNLGDSLTDLLAANLARSTGLRVVSTRGPGPGGQQAKTSPESGAGDAMTGARNAGATDLVDGALLTPAPGQLQLELRRVDLGSGAVLKVYTLWAADLQTLADSGAHRLLRDLGATAPSHPRPGP